MDDLNVVIFPTSNFEGKIKDSKTSFIMDSRDFWHNGIHFNSIEEVRNVCDGEVVAMRLSTTYENTYTYNYLTLAFLVLIKRIKLTDDKFENYFESQDDGYKLKANLTDAEKEKAYKLIEELFSISFVMMKHSLLNTKGKEITFYSLAQHLKPIGRMTTMQKMKLHWFERTFIKNQSSYYYVEVNGVTTDKRNKRGETKGRIPCETKISYSDDANAGPETKIEITWIQNGTTYRGTVEKQYIRDKYKEIKRPARTDAEKESNEYLPSEYEKKSGEIQVFTTENLSTRQSKAILDIKNEFQITETEFIEKYPNTNVLKIKYMDNNQTEQTGYIYLDEVTDDDKKKWESLKTQITGKTEDTITFSNIEINIKLKEGIKVDSVCVPKDRTVPQGVGIGFAGFTVTKEKDEKTLENEDATAVHYEIFCEKTDFMNFKEDEQLDLREPAEYKINKPFICFKEKPTTKKEIKADIGLKECSYIKKEDRLTMIDNETFIKVKILADAKSAADCCLLRADLGNWKENPCSRYAVEKDTVCDAYKKTESGSMEKIENGQIQLYENYDYLYQNADGTHRVIKYIYEPRNDNKSFWVRLQVFNDNFKVINDRNEYILEKVLPENEMFEAPNELEANEEIKISGGDISVCNGEVNKYAGKKVEQTWVKVKVDGNEYWTEKKNISSKKDHEPVEQLAYNDWRRFFTEIKTEEIGKYKWSGEKEGMKKLGFTDGQFEIFNRKMHGGSSYTLSALIKSDSKRTDKFYFKNKTEWMKNDDLTAAMCKGDQFEEKIKRLREKYVFWEEAKKLHTAGFPKSDTNWYFHPAEFIKHLDKVATIPEFNPYEGMTIITPNDMHIEVKSNGDKHNVGSSGCTMQVIDNPGFAPKLRTETPYSFNGKYFAKITGGFAEDYTDVICDKVLEQTYRERNRPGDNPKKHQGIDFSGTIKDEIISFIYGTVVGYGVFGAFGNAVIVGAKDGIGVYLMAHLSSFNKKNLDRGYVVPGDSIGNVGGTGTDGVVRYAVHLHVSYYHYKWKDKKIVSKVDEMLINDGLDDYALMHKELANPFSHGSKFY